MAQIFHQYSQKKHKHVFSSSRHAQECLPMALLLLTGLQWTQAKQPALAEWADTQKHINTTDTTSQSNENESSTANTIAG